MITEVLYAVPTGEIGDANQDGKRSATGDEFIELTNPHDKPINLKGYRIADKSVGKSGAMNFVFPECELKPHEVVVVFNGFESTIPGALGDSGKAAGPNDKFHNARVFSMKIASNRVSLNNTADAVLLIDPKGQTIELIKWGAITEDLPECKLVEEVPTTNKASVQRKGMTRSFVTHESVEGKPFSPGAWDAKGTTPPPKAPEPKKDPAPEKPKPADKPKKK